MAPKDGGGREEGVGDGGVNDETGEWIVVGGCRSVSEKEAGTCGLRVRVSVGATAGCCWLLPLQCSSFEPVGSLLLVVRSLLCCYCMWCLLCVGKVRFPADSSVTALPSQSSAQKPAGSRCSRIERC